MNKRILEIAKQAGFGLRRDGEIYTSRLEHLPITEDIEKFAELIVRECVLHLHKRGIEGFGILEERNLKEHFGVQ